MITSKTSHSALVTLELIFGDRRIPLAQAAHNFAIATEPVELPPGKGEIVIFNRSHYEDVLITRVHDWIDQKECDRRYKQIRDFESILAETGTVILKFFLHLSKAEQKQRLEERLADPDKHWKFDPQDLLEREHWDHYQQVYADAIAASDAKHAPWYIIPADSKTQRNLAIAQIVNEKLLSLKLTFPSGNPEYSKIKVI